MRKNFLIYLKLILLGIIFTSCVYTKFPIGIQNCKIVSQDWEGIWVNQEVALYIKVSDSKNGVLDVAWIELDNQHFKLETMKVYLKKYKNWLFANVKDKEEKGLYLWAKIDKKDNLILIWLPNLDKFKKLVKNKILPGSISKYDVTLDKFTLKDYELLTSDNYGCLFEWQEPIILFKP